MSNAQQWLDATYPKEKRSKIKELPFHARGLKGDLKLEGFDEVTFINFNDNYLTFLDITDCKKLETLYFDANQITSLDLSQNLQLKDLSIASNNFPEQELSFLSHLVNLEKLDVSNRHKKNIKEGIYNRFVGSLKPLKKLTKLKKLNISNTDIEEGLECLPSSLAEIIWSDDQGLDAKVSKIHKKLTPYDHNYQTWRKDKKVQKEIEKEIWKEKGFNEEEANQLIELDLKINEEDFTTYLKQIKQKNDNLSLDIGKLRKEYLQAQTWLDFNYSEGIKREINKKLQNVSSNTLGTSKIKVSEETSISFPLKGIPNKYWNKVEVGNDWDREYVEAKKVAIPMMKSLDDKTTWDRQFRSQTDLDNFRKYISDSKKKEYFTLAGMSGNGYRAIEDFTTDDWLFIEQPDKKLTQLLRESNKLFVKDGYGKVKSQEAFEYLKSIIESHEIEANVKISQGDEFNWEEWNITELDITELDIANRGIEGTLNLSKFINLEVLNCERNKLTSLDVSKCSKIREIRCAKNELENLITNEKKENNLELLEHLDARENKLTDISFLLENLKSKRLEILRLGGNKLSTSLDINNLTSLKELDMSDCPNGGSLKLLKELDGLKILNITNTNFSEGIELLPKSCKKLYCDSDYQSKSNKIAKELDKSRCSEEETVEGEKVKYYKLDKWRADRANDATTSVIPLERLFVIRSNLSQFLKKWGSEEQNGQTKLSQLRSPEQFKKFQYLSGIQSLSTATSIIGSGLTLANYSTAGGVITLVAPLVGTGVSQLKTTLYDEKEKKWEEFKTDADSFLDNYNALRGILKQVEVDEWGKVNLALKNLKEETNKFLKEYDKDGNGEIDIEELIDKRVKFSNELDKIRKINEAIQALEDKVVEYQKGDLTEKGDETEVKTEEGNEEDTSQIDDNKLFQKTIEELSYKAKLDNEELEEEIKEKFKKEYRREVVFLLKGKKDNQILVISQKQRNSNIIEDILPNWMNKNYALDLVEKKENNTEIERSLSFPKWFSSQKEAMEKALEAIELTEEQKEQIQRKANKIIEIEKNNKPKSSEKGQEKLMILLEEILLEKEKKELKETENSPSSENLWKKGKSLFCCGKKDKNEQGIRRSLSENRKIIENLDNNQESDDLDKYSTEEPVASTSKNNSSAQLLEDKTVATGSTSQSTSLFRRRSISKQQTDDIEMGIMNQDRQLETHQQIPPKGK